MKTVVLLNSRSGGALSPEEVEASVSGCGLDTRVLPIEELEPDDLVALAADCDLLVAAGGDGTVNAAAQALYKADSKAVLGLLPLGTGNDLARTLEVPTGLEAAARVLVHGATQPLDVVLLDEDRIMINQANGGFSGTLAQTMDEKTKDRWGPLAYLRASVDVFTEMPEYEVELDIDGERLSTRLLNLSVANGRYSAGGVPVAPDADPSDGMFDVVLFQAAMKRAILPLAPRILMGTHVDTEEVIFRRGKLLRLHAEPTMPFSIDGELCDEHPSSFELLPGRLRVMVPA